MPGPRGPRRYQVDTGFRVLKKDEWLALANLAPAAVGLRLPSLTPPTTPERR